MAKDEALVQLKKTRNIEISEAFWRSVEVRLRTMKKSKNWLAEQTGLSAQSMTSAKYLHSTISIFTVLRISRALDCTIEELLYGSASTENAAHMKKSAALIEEVKKDKSENSRSVAATVELFQNLPREEKKAVLVHILTLMGRTPKEAVEWLEEAEVAGDEKNS